MIEKTIYSENELRLFAQEFSKKISGNEVITLVGQLGAGKTTFAKYLINSFIPDAEITSPTFPILNQYSNDFINISHFDLYRIKQEEELIEIGFEDVLKSGLSIIEWPEIAVNYLPSELIIIKIEIADNGKRVLKIKNAKL